MPDRTVAGLRAALKSLKDVVGPAIDPGNPLANEQLRMVCNYLALVCEHLPLRGARIAFELRSAIALAQALEPHAARCDAVAAAALVAALAGAQRLREAPDPAEADVESATAALNAAISALVRTAAQADEALRRTVERACLAHAQNWLTVQRAWYAPLGFDLERAALPPLAQAVARER